VLAEQHQHPVGGAFEHVTLRPRARQDTDAEQHAQQRLGISATAALANLGVEVLTGSAVERIDDEGVVVSGRRMAARNVFWAAGVMASPAAKWLKAETDQAGRVKVVEDLSVPGLPEIFAIGDTALSNGWDGKPVPGLAPAAKQQGRYVASVIKARIHGRPISPLPLPPRG
jgi:NADH dehydrogenase FAD-containing subunit